MTEYFTKDGDDFKEVGDTLFTQSEIDTNIIPKRLERERSKFADYDSIKEKAGKVDTITSEYTDKLAEKDVTIGDLTTQVQSANLATDKVKIVSEFKLSDELAEFVTGKDVEEMRTRAEKLSKANGSKGAPIVKDGKPAEDNKESGNKSIARNLFGRNQADA